MDAIPLAGGLGVLDTKYPAKTQAYICGTTDFYSCPPITSAPLKTPCYPISAEPDSRPPLPAYDLATREPEHRARLWRCGRKAIYGRHLDSVGLPTSFGNIDPYELTLTVFTDASRVPARARRKCRVEPSSAISNQAADLITRREWKRNSLWRRHRQRFRDFGEAPRREPDKQPAIDTSQLAADYLGAGGAISYYQTESDLMTKQIELTLDASGAWRVGHKKDAAPIRYSYFDRFDEAQRFALRTALTWRREHWTSQAAVKVDDVIRLSDGF